MYAAAKPPELPGFRHGMWHGAIMPVTFILSLLKNSVGIYEVQNANKWYDLGYMREPLIFLGGSHASRK